MAGAELQVSLTGGGVEEADGGVVRAGGEARAGVVPAQTVDAAWVCARTCAGEHTIPARVSFRR